SAKASKRFTLSDRRNSEGPDSLTRDRLMRKTARHFLLAAAFALAPVAASAQDYPTRAITVIMPFAGGSASDVVARILLNQMSKSLGQPIIVENKPGAGGNAGTASAARSTPDGYTLLGGGSGPVAANVSLYKQLGYDPLKELDMISPFAAFTIVVTAS